MRSLRHAAALAAHATEELFAVALQHRVEARKQDEPTDAAHGYAARPYFFSSSGFS
jgi:hypothetical protein